MFNNAAANNFAASFMRCLTEFWESLMIPVFIDNTVPKSQKMPYVTYNFRLPEIAVKVNTCATIWTYSSEFAQIDELTEMLFTNMPMEGVLIDIPDTQGVLKLSRANPFIENVAEKDYLSKARKINYYITRY